MTLALLKRPSTGVAGAEQASCLTDAVYRQHVHTVARWAARLAGPRGDVEDIVQEVFLTVHRTIPSFRGAARLETWLYRITHNVVRHRRRKDRWRRWLGGSAEDVAGDVPSKERSGVELLEQDEANRRVYAVLDALSEKYRTVLILFELEELSGEQISELTGVKLATVWVHLHRGRAEFLRRLAAAEDG